MGSHCLISATGFEDSVAILQKKCELDHKDVPDEVVQFIASLFTTNVRDLEGALNRAIAFSQLMGTPLTVQSLAAILQPATPAQKVCAHY